MKLHIDIETYSSVDLRASGIYAYAASPDFEITLLAYKLGDAATHLIDLLQGDAMPLDLLAAFANPTVEIYAHNAAFERVCLAAAGYPIAPERFVCTATKAGYCGVPMSLAGAGAALELPADKAKDAAGKALIRYFCVPCKPTKANGHRHRNLPHHDPAKWAQFGAYCVQDVVAEVEIDRRLARYAIPAWEHAMYALDQRINDRGVRVDTQLAEAALRIDAIARDRALRRIANITGLENPNSVAQLKKWISEETDTPVASLAKEAAALLHAGSDDDAVREVLDMRAKLAKSSVKKYAAILHGVNADGRVRGLFKFYGASRTGRWAGQRVQMQNLPRNYMPDLDDARQHAKAMRPADFVEQYEDTADVLSQLIRTAFVPSDDRVLLVADYSAIEARVLAWLAGEKWRLDVFNSHGKIYEASAAAMFSVPIESVTKGSDLRSKGKVSELALGYQGGPGALLAMGALNMGLAEAELPDIVSRWRAANPAIVWFWVEVGRAAITAMRSTHARVTIGGLDGRPRITFTYDGVSLRVTLPSGRDLHYWGAVLGAGKFDKPALKYKDAGGKTGAWRLTDTYGGKLVENITQAVARDLLAHGLANAHRLGFPILAHVHDEIIAEAPQGVADAALEGLCAAMCDAPTWAAGLPLAAEGFTTSYYKKD